MVGRHEGETREFRELTFAEQAEAIEATIHNLEAAIEHHIEHSPHRAETIATCLAEVDGLRRRLKTSHEWPEARAGSGGEQQSVGARPRVHVGSPRLARPEQAIDFVMEVGEDDKDAGLR